MAKALTKSVTSSTSNDVVNRKSTNYIYCCMYFHLVSLFFFSCFHFFKKIVDVTKSKTVSFELRGGITLQLNKVLLNTVEFGSENNNY